MISTSSIPFYSDTEGPPGELFVYESNSADTSLRSLNRSFLIRNLSLHGVVVLRGFEADVTEFSRLVESITPSTAIDPARAFFAKNVQLVDSGTNEIGLHCENGTTPLVPHVVWFFCERAAQSGSQTTVCDGKRVYRDLSADVQRIFRENRVVFSRNVKSDLWIKWVTHHFPQMRDKSSITQEMLDSVFGHISGAQVRINADGSLFLSHAAYAAHPTFFPSTLAFATSLFGPSFNYEAPSVHFENGKEIPSWALDEARSVAGAFTENIPWESGDIVMIDNTRVMHGRRAITDTNRKLFTSLGFLKEDDRTASVALGGTNWGNA